MWHTKSRKKTFMKKERLIATTILVRELWHLYEKDITKHQMLVTCLYALGMLPEDVVASLDIDLHSKEVQNTFALMVKEAASAYSGAYEKTFAVSETSSKNKDIN